ncbi:MAG: UDP-glucose 4-epimerase GalE [Firmicutes bacterium HGW-Firmicutes-9]|jgi:UDP-glucose 4-epimerase|nr:MAG: UDP-glucose 4-epimerase GalE [Firmicutes bacterium HGW-Firmicutes-9]
MRILVTGGAGYIGSHTVLELLDAGYDVVIADNFVNSKPAALDRLCTLASKPFQFEEVDLTDAAATDALFQKYPIDAMIHFAGLKAVGESVQLPLEYYRNNLTSTFNLLISMQKHGVEKFVFSSSATVYGDPVSVPIREDFALSATNPYGRTKLMIEDMLRDVSIAQPDMRICLLRYFNPVGAHISGKIGEDPNGIPNNLMPYIAQVAVGKLPALRVFGNDYPTPDGTGVRDYIHVVDLAKGHVAALKKLESGAGVYTYNLGTGVGYSVLDMLHAFEKACGKTLPYEIVARRPGDIAACYADPEKAASELGWRAEFGIERMCADAWRWQSQNPNGFEG